MTTTPETTDPHAVGALPDPVRWALKQSDRQHQRAQRAEREIVRLEPRLGENQPLRVLKLARAAHAKAGRVHTKATENAALFRLMAEAGAEKVGMLLPPVEHPEPVRDRARPVRVGALTYALTALAVRLTPSEAKSGEQS